MAQFVVMAYITRGHQWVWYKEQMDLHWLVHDLKGVQRWSNPSTVSSPATRLPQFLVVVCGSWFWLPWKDDLSL